MRKFIEAFKAFAFKGNVVDMAVGVVVGAAFSKIVTSLVADIITPLISLLTGGQNFSNLFIILNRPDGVDISTLKTITAANDAGCATLNYGSFIQNIIDFFLIALSIFMVVRLFGSVRSLAKKKEAEASKVVQAPKVTEEVLLLREIRDSLKK